MGDDVEAFLLTEINRSNDLIAASRSPRQPESGTVTPPAQMVFSKEDRPPRRASNPVLVRSNSCGAGGTGRSGSGGNNSRDSENSPSSKLTGTSSLPSSRHVSPINTSDSCTTSPSSTATTNNGSSGTQTPDEKKSSSLMRKLSSPGKLFSGNRTRAISDSKADRSESSSQISLMSVTPRAGHDNVRSTRDTAAESETVSSGGGGGLYSREANSSASSRLLVEPSEEQKIRQVRDILAPTVQERPRTNSFGRSNSSPFMVASMVSRTPVVTPPGERVMNARSVDEHLLAMYRHIEGLDKRLKRTEANNTLLVQEAVGLQRRMGKLEGNSPYCWCCCCCSWISSCLGLGDDDDDDDDAKHILLSSELARK